MVLERVLEEFNSFEGAATNIKYQMGDTHKSVLTNLLTMCAPTAFAKLQRIHDALPANLSPVTVEALGTTHWLIDAFPKSFKDHSQSQTGSGDQPSVQTKVQWRNALRMTAAGQDLLMDRLALMCDVAAKKHKASTVRLSCVLDKNGWEDEALYMRWCAHGISQFELLMKTQADSSDAEKMAELTATLADVRRRCIEGAYKETFSGLYSLKEPFEYR